MDDLISRRALMKEFSDFVRESNNSDFAQIPTWNDAVSLAESMPSAERRGRWELVDEAEPRRYGCSVCKRLSWYESNYCPHCGAKMDEV